MIFDVTLQDPNARFMPGSGRSRPSTTVVTADAVEYITSGETIVAVKFITADGTLAATFAGTVFVSAVARPAS